MPVELNPPLPVQREIHQSASHFLRAVAEAGLVEGIVPRPKVNPKPNGFATMKWWMAMGRLEGTINPRRLKPGDSALNAMAVQSPCGEPHLFALIESLTEIRDGLTAVFAHWHLEQFWGCESSGCGGTLNPGGSWRPGHVHFDVPPGGFPPLSKNLFDAMAYAVSQLAECIRAVEEATHHQPDSDAKQEPPNKIITPVKPVRRDKKIEARDKWIYEQCCAGKPHDKIVAELKRKAPAKGWKVFTTKNRVWQIGKEYAERNGLKLPPPRQNL